MILLKDLKADYGSKDIGALVDFVRGTTLSLQDDQKYRFEKSGKVVHIDVTDPYWISEEYTRGSRDEVKKVVLDLLPR